MPEGNEIKKLSEIADVINKANTVPTEILQVFIERKCTVEEAKELLNVILKVLNEGTQKYPEKETQLVKENLFESQ